MKPDISYAMNDRTSQEFNGNLPSGEVIDRYINILYGIVDKATKYKLKPFEIIEGIKYSINKRYKQIPVKLHNSYNETISDTEVLKLANELLQNGAIMTTQGVLFSRHGAVKNPFYNFIQYLLDKRDDAKKEMKKYPKGSELYQKYNLLQLNYKVACNALYGCAGNFSSVYYNLYLCSAVTGQGRGCISASITMFEGFLANNVKFGSLTEALTFIENICIDLEQPLKFSDYDVLDRNISVEECFLKVMRNCGYNSWIPSDKARDIIWTVINNLSQKQLNAVYYCNNLYEFCNNNKVKNLILKILVDLDKPFLNPLNPPENIVDDLEMLKDLMFQYVYYRHLWIDKLERVYTMIRDVVLITDTDSCIVSLDEWYKYVLKDTIGIPMRVKYTIAERKEAAEKVVMEYRRTELPVEYDFYNKTLVDKKRLEYPAVVIEEDGLRYSIINIMSYVVGELIMDYMELFSEQYNTAAPDRECLLIMKNEFLFKSLLLKGRKNYASVQVVQEGNLIPEDKQFDIKGMPIAKVGMAESTAKQLSEILEFDILRRDFVDQVELIRKFATIEQIIYNSIKAKEKAYHKPARIKSMSNYELPFRIQGIKASVAYNMIREPGNEPIINLDERNTILIIKTVINRKNADKIAKEYPQHYARLLKVLDDDNYKGKVEAIAIPMNSEIPNWVVPFINYTEIIHDNLRTFPLEQIGISKLENNDVTHTNLMYL